jgi:hypothetical protein
LFVFCQCISSPTDMLGSYSSNHDTMCPKWSSNLIFSLLYVPLWWHQFFLLCHSSHWTLNYALYFESTQVVFDFTKALSLAFALNLKRGDVVTLNDVIITD